MRRLARLFMSMLAIFFPWAVLLIYDNPGGALIALILQATAIGWIPASIWAWQTMREADKHKKSAKAQAKENPAHE